MILTQHKYFTDAQLAQYERIADICDLKYGFLTGGAGSGKTTVVREIIKTIPHWGQLSATTGVAATILREDMKYAVPTVFALLQCADVREFRRAFENGRLSDSLAKIKVHSERLIIDECSMLLAEIFSYIYRAARNIGLGLILIGDFLQLPPVVTKENWAHTPQPWWAFQSMYWPEFTNGRGITNGSGVIKLMKNHRQAGMNPDFLELLNCLRAGDGATAATLVERAGCVWNWRNNADLNFHGMTLVGGNTARDVVNDNRYKLLHGQQHEYRKTSFGKQWPEWQKIPESISVRPGMRVMITRNRYDNGELTQANGTMGTVMGFDERSVTIRPDNGADDLMVVDRYEEDNSQWLWVPNNNPQGGYWEKVDATARVSYMPLTPAWALTVHKAQGLSVKQALQIDISSSFFGKCGGLTYVAASRAKSNPLLLTFAGSGNLPSRCYVDPAVAVWI